jgi:predicted nucleic acid-binding Zn ribbon protein
LQCSKEISSNKKFCNNSCSAKFNNKKRIHNKCLVCDKDISSRNKYCSNKCQNEKMYIDFISNWKLGKLDGSIGSFKDDISKYIRKYIFIKYNNKCCQFGWSEYNQFTNKIPLQVDHIDGNHKNNNEDNLRLLCPNCHSLTKNYGSLNNGNGREGRRIWRLNNKK